MMCTPATGDLARRAWMVSTQTSTPSAALLGRHPRSLRMNARVTWMPEPLVRMNPTPQRADRTDPRPAAQRWPVRGRPIGHEPAKAVTSNRTGSGRTARGGDLLAEPGRADPAGGANGSPRRDEEAGGRLDGANRRANWPRQRMVRAVLPAARVQVVDGWLRVLADRVITVSSSTFGMPRVSGGDQVGLQRDALRSRAGQLHHRFDAGRAPATPAGHADKARGAPGVGAVRGVHPAAQPVRGARDRLRVDATRWPISAVTTPPGRDRRARLIALPRCASVALRARAYR